MSTPLITIFVRHTPGCKWAGDEFTKKCNCRKHFRWSQNGKQYRRQAGTRSWTEAEDNKRNLVDQLSGRVVAPIKTGLLLTDAIQTFHANKESQGVKPKVRALYIRELRRLQKFSDEHNKLTVSE